MTDEKKEFNSKKTQDLVIFTAKEEDQSTAVDKYTFEKFDQEDKIKLFNDFRRYGGHYKYSIQLNNESLAPITDVKIKIIYPKFLKVSRWTPPTIYLPESIEEKDIMRITLEYDEVVENSSKAINLYFTPIALNNEGEIRTVITYVNNKDFVRVIDSDIAKVIIHELTINPKVIPSSQIREISQTPGIIKVIKSLGIGTNLRWDIDLYFNILEQFFLIHNFQLVTKDPVKRILWFFGTDLESEEDILAIGQIVSNKIELIATSQNQEVLISLLTLFTNDFTEQLIRRGLINSEDQIFELECEICGAILPYFPKKGEEIECTKCNYEQMVW